MVADTDTDFSADRLAQLIAVVADNQDKEAFRSLFDYLRRGFELLSIARERTLKRPKRSYKKRL